MLVVRFIPYEYGLVLSADVLESFREFKLIE